MANLIASLSAIAVGIGVVLLDASRCFGAGFSAFAAICTIAAGFVASCSIITAVYEAIHAVDVSGSRA